MNLLAHALTQGLVDALVSPHAAQAVELCRHDGCEEMPTIALDLAGLAGKPGFNVLLNLSWSRR